LEDFGTKTFLNYSTIETGRATTLISPDSERTFGTYLGAAIDLKAPMLHPDHFKGFDFLHFEGYLVQDKELVMRAVELAKQNNMTISVDMASFNIVESNREFFKMLISEHVDIVFANEDEARSLTGKEPHEALHEISEKCQIAVIKLGEKGSIVKSGKEIAAIQAIQAKSIDTTGAGDLYAAGFILGLTRNKPLSECGYYGSLLAGKTIEVFGAKMDEERWKQVQAVIPHTQEVLK
jgi:sugar/nucleoside kinase (ribokinase family)